MTLAPSAEDQVAPPAETVATDAVQVEAAPVQEAQDDKPADSSVADDKTPAKPKSMLDAITSAIEQKAEAKVESQTTKPEEGAADAVKPEDEQPPFHKHPAWQRQRELVKTRDAMIADLTPKAERFDQLQGMMQRGNLVDEEVDAGLNIMVAMKTDAFKARELLRPYWEALQKVTGAAELPEDLAADVESGAVNEAKARELSEHRARAAQAEANEERNQKQSAAKLQQDVFTATSTWEAEWKSSDPDYPKKAKLVSDRIVAIMSTEGAPRDSKSAVSLASRARKEVEESLRGVIAPPKPKVVTPLVSSATSTVPKPRTALEAMNRAIDATGTGM
jgi:hypothetical protein